MGRIQLDYYGMYDHQFLKYDNVSESIESTENDHFWSLNKLLADQAIPYRQARYAGIFSYFVNTCQRMSTFQNGTPQPLLRYLTL